MRKEISEQQLDAVVGGKVHLSGNKMTIRFDTISDTKHPLNCTYQEARNLLVQLFCENDTLSDSAFDALVKQEFTARGWI